MILLRKKARSVLCLLIIIAFFVPAYRSTSAFSFLWVAMSATARGQDVNTTDTLVMILPLLMVPLSAIFLLIFSELRIAVRRANVALPVIFLTFFTVVFYVSERTGQSGLSPLKMILSMQPGFYLAALSSVGLLFTKNQKRKRRHRRREVAEPQPQATA